MQTDLVNGLGFCQFYDTVPTRNVLNDKNDVLLVGSSVDVGNILQTVAQNRGRKLKFYLLNSEAAILSRCIILLYIVMSTEMTVIERRDLYLDFYANSLVTEKHANWLTKNISQILKIISEESSDPLSEVLKFEFLKFCKRDAILETVMNWKKDANIPQLRDQRCRAWYGERFNHRVNLLDWDYQWNIRQFSPNIHWREYKEFGLTGIAFSSRSTENRVPNNTLVSYLRGKENNKSVDVRGFWGDIVNSPYPPLGVSTRPQFQERFFQKHQDQHRYSGQDISEFNLQILLTEIDTVKDFDLPIETEDEKHYPFERLVLGDFYPDGKHSPVWEGVEVMLCADEICDLLKKKKYFFSF
eukprot:GHVL01006184.1.p1 GENE.GHVL01006184.1~~GHVL01006184.1.p1  ORF type:complete len:356 (+),score=67.27 GHVL01006184.1:17-1084(+)